MLPELFRSLNSPLLPLSTGAEPQLQSLLEVRAVIFDIYGTLIISAAGDISMAGGGVEKGASIRQAITAETESTQVIVAEDDSLEAQFFELIQQFQEKRRGESITYPEVEIRDIWQALLHQNGFNDVPAETVERIATRYECLTNPVWPMPQLQQVLSQFAKNSQIELGIVSNAQFYTLEMFPAFLDDQSLETIGFAPDLQVYSYRQLEGKPSTALYECIVENLAKRGLSPDQALFVGNDMRNDIWPASAVGMKTALFAGDRRSLRLREDDPRVADVVPDIVVTELSQLVDCVS